MPTKFPRDVRLWMKHKGRKTTLERPDRACIKVRELVHDVERRLAMLTGHIANREKLRCCPRAESGGELGERGPAVPLLVLPAGRPIREAQLR
jgi:hypothetical protein